MGAHIISQLLEKGYVVRATARSASKLQSIFPKATAEQLQVVEVPTLISDHSAALKGVDALIHSASPIYGEGVSGQELYSVSLLSPKPENLLITIHLGSVRRNCCACQAGHRRWREENHCYRHVRKPF